MNRRFLVAALTTAVALVLVISRAQGQTPAPNANDAVKKRFPLMAPAGKDSGALNTAPPGAVNQGPLDPAKWKYGHAFDAPKDAKIWNPVMLKMMKGESVVGVTIITNDPEVYCTTANAGYDFTWAEMQHSNQERDWETLARMFKACPHAKAVPGVRVAYNDEREIQHAMDIGALVILVPTVRSVAEGKAAVEHVMYPPLGSRSCCAGQAYTREFWGTVPGGYRKTINQNVVIIAMIETVDGVAAAREIAAIPGVTAIYASSTDIGNFSGYKEGEPDYERLINIVHDAAIGAGKTLCGRISWLGRADFTCFQAAPELEAIIRGAATELEPLKDRRATKPEVGPYAPNNSDDDSPVIRNPITLDAPERSRGAKER